MAGGQGAQWRPDLFHRQPSVERRDSALEGYGLLDVSGPQTFRGRTCLYSYGDHLTHLTRTEVASSQEGFTNHVDRTDRHEQSLEAGRFVAIKAWIVASKKL